MPLLCRMTCTSTFFDHCAHVVSLNQNRTSPVRCDQLVLLVDALPSHKVAMLWPHLTNPLQKLAVLLLDISLLTLMLFQDPSQPLHDLERVSAGFSANGN